MKQWGILPILSLYALFPFIFILGKKGFVFGPALIFISLYMIIAGITLLCAYSFHYKKKPFIDPLDWKLILEGSIFGFFLAYFPDFITLKYLSAAKVSFFFVLSPFFSFIFDFFRNKETMTMKKLIGVVIAFCGVLPLFSFATTQTENAAPYPAFFLEIIVIACVASYSFSWFSVQTLTSQKKYSSLLVTGMNMLIGGTLCLATSFLIRGYFCHYPPITNLFMYNFYIFFISLVVIFCYSLYAILLRHYSATFISSSGFIEPLFAALYGWIFLGETVSWIFFASTVIVAIGLYIFYLEELRINPQR